MQISKDSSKGCTTCKKDNIVIQQCILCQLVDRYKGKKAIFIADRNYESYNGFEHVVQSGNKYLIRMRDIYSKLCITQLNIKRQQ